MKIGQISFIRLTSPVDNLYGSPGLGSKYQGQIGPIASKYYQGYAGES
jgi:dCTP deaminase